MIKEPLFSPGELVVLASILTLACCLWVYLSTHAAFPLAAPLLLGR